MKRTLAKQVYEEELAMGTPPNTAAVIAMCAFDSPEYWAAWLAERAGRLREREEQEEALLAELSYPGNPSLEEL